MAHVPKSGRNGLIYLSTVDATGELSGANGWSVEYEHESHQSAKYGDTTKTTYSGLQGWSVSISAEFDYTKKQLLSAAQADSTVAFAIYPDRTDTSTYYNGSAVFAMGNDAPFDGVITASATGVGSGALSDTGWT